MECVSDSGDEGDPTKPFPKCDSGRRLDQGTNDCVYSDDDDGWFPNPSITQPLDYCSKENANGFSQPLGGSCGSIFAARSDITRASKLPRRARAPHRALVSKAAAAAMSSAQENAIAAGFDREAEVDWSQVSFARGGNTAAALQPPTFLGRSDVVLHPMEPQEPTQNPAAPSPQPAGSPRGDSRSSGPRQSAPAERGNAAGIVPAATAAAKRAPSGRHGSGAPGMVTQRTDDGINVVYKKRQQESATGGEPSGKKARSSAVNSGWGNNFVRIDLKVSLGMWTWHCLPFR